MTYPFKPTAKCPKLPAIRGPGKLSKPCPELTDDDVDQCLHFMITHGAEDMLLPATQYGRRIAAEAHLAYERILPVFTDHKPWTPKEAVQPR